MASLSADSSSTGNWRAELLRPAGLHSAEVKPIELFFDLVYVLAVTQLTHYLVEHLTLRGAMQTLVLLLAVWSAWINVAGVSNFFNMGARPVRLALLGLMFASLIMSAFLPEAFSGRGFIFAAAFVAVICGGLGLAGLGLGPGNLQNTVGRMLVWCVAISMLWLSGGLADDNARLLIWLIAATLMLMATWLGFPLPGKGRLRTTDFTISGAHFAERCFLFIIIALGESIIVAGAQFGELPSSTTTVAAFVVVFVGTVTFWWIYFDREEEAAMERIAVSDDPRRLGLIAYTYCHIPMVAGIIVAAAAAEVTIAHPSDDVTTTTAALILSGPVLFLAGNELFLWSIWEYISPKRLIAIAALAALIPVAAVASNLVLTLAATLVLVALAFSDFRLERQAWQSHVLRKLAATQPDAHNGAHRERRPR